MMINEYAIALRSHREARVKVLPVMTGKKLLMWGKRC